MPLTLVLGPANSAKAGEVLGAFADAAPSGALLVVPTAWDAEHYSRELAGQGCVLRSVLTFSGLVSEIARRVGYRARVLTGLQREWVLRRAIRRSGLQTLGEVSSTPGFLEAAVKLVAELERAMVAPPRFAAALRSWAEHDRRRQSYAHDVGALYLAYAAELERIGSVDAELFGWRALDGLRVAPARWGGDAVFFYGFDDLHELERDAIETLARIVGTEVTVSLTFEPGRTALKARAEVAAELRQLAGRVVDLPARDDYYAPQSRAALHHLERSLFEPDARRLDPGRTVRLLEAAGELAEAELVAAEIRGLLDAGTAPEEVAVVHRLLAPATAQAIGRAFERYRIPVAMAHPLGFGHTALGRGVLALARCALGAGGAGDLLAYVRTPGVVRRPEVADQLEVSVRGGGLQTVAQAREALGWELGELDAVREAADQLGELVRQARRLIALPFAGQAPVLDGGERFDAAALAALVACADQLRALGGAPAGRDLLELLEGLELAARPTPPRGAVLVTDPLSIRARRFAHIFVCGLQEGAFPWIPAPDPFLPDERRRELTAVSGLRLRLHEDALDRERYLFYACVSRATEGVALSYRSSDEEGSVSCASPFIEDVAEALDAGWRDRRRRRLLADVTWSVEEAPNPRERALAEAASEPGPGDAPPARDAPRLTPRALGHVRHTTVLSAGALENYAECHMKWLVERELRPAVLEPEPEPLARGRWVHDVLERVLARLGGAITPESLPDAIGLLDETIAEVRPQLAAGRPEALQRAVAETIVADLRRYLEREAECGCGWSPRALELRFGFEDEEEGESLPALVIRRAGEQIAVRGAIDRVDVELDGRRAIVRDYKTGSARSEHQGSRWRSDQRLQVALYMVAVRELLGLEPVAGLYQPLVGKDLRPRGIYLEGPPVEAGLVPTDARDPASLQAELDHACERAVALAQALRAGELAPSPETCSREGCRYPGICRVD